MANHLWLSLVALFSFSSAALAGVSGKVVDEDGKPVAAVVYADVATGDRTAAPKPVEVRQRDKHFVPRLIAIEVGQPVKFPNDDHVFHNVFSAAPGNAFDLGLFKAGAKYDEATLSKVDKGPESGVVRFKAPGRVDVFCNIHPAMSAVIVVLGHKYFTRSDEDGGFSLAALLAFWLLLSSLRHGRM